MKSRFYPEAPRFSSQLPASLRAAAPLAPADPLRVHWLAPSSLALPQAVAPCVSTCPTQHSQVQSVQQRALQSVQQRARFDPPVPADRARCPGQGFGPSEALPFRPAAHESHSPRLFSLPAPVEDVRPPAHSSAAAWTRARPLRVSSPIPVPSSRPLLPCSASPLRRDCPVHCPSLQLPSGAPPEALPLQRS